MEQALVPSILHAPPPADTLGREALAAHRAHVLALVHGLALVLLARVDSADRRVQAALHRQPARHLVRSVQPREAAVGVRNIRRLKKGR